MKVLSVQCVGLLGFMRVVFRMRGFSIDLNITSPHSINQGVINYLALWGLY